MFYDVVVVGAGPAGAVAAWYAAKSGASVLLLERDREPGVPVRCAEGASQAGVHEFLDPDPRWVSAKTKTLRIISPDGNHADLNHLRDAYILERRVFDKTLCDKACNAGAKLLVKADAVRLYKEDDTVKGVVFKHLGEEKTVRCNIVIGADGIESRVGRWAGIKTELKVEDLEPTAQYTLTGIKVDSTVSQFFVGAKYAPGGYAWIFPKSETSANVGLGIATQLANGKNAKYYLDKFVDDVFPDASRNYLVLGSVPTSGTLPQITTDNVMLVGDAARQVDPLTGAGILNGMFAAKIAGTVAGEALKKKDFSKKFLKKYQKQWHNDLGKRLAILHELKETYFGFSEERFNNIVKSLNKMPSSDIDVKKLFVTAVKDDPKLVLQVSKAFLIGNFIK